MSVIHIASKDELDQNARSILLSHFTSQRQQWALLFASSVVGYYTLASAVLPVFPGILQGELRIWLVAGFVAMIPHFIVKMLWYARMASNVLSAYPSAVEDPRYSYLVRLEHGISDRVRANTFFGIMYLARWLYLFVGGPLIAFFSYCLLKSYFDLLLPPLVVMVAFAAILWIEAFDRSLGHEEQVLNNELKVLNDIHKSASEPQRRTQRNQWWPFRE